GRRGDVLRLVRLCAVGIEQDQGVVTDVRGGRRLEGREDDLRGGRQVTVRLVDRILHVEREGLEQREIGRRGWSGAVDLADSGDRRRGLVDAEGIFLRGRQPRQNRPRLVG